MPIKQPDDTPALFKNAKADGRWARAYDGARTAVVPEDLIAACEADCPAAGDARAR